MDRELSAILELPFITIMAAMITIFCRFEMIMHEACRNSDLLLFEVKNGELQRILSLKQNLAAYPCRVPFFILRKRYFCLDDCIYEDPP